MAFNPDDLIAAVHKLRNDMLVVLSNFEVAVANEEPVALPYRQRSLYDFIKRASAFPMLRILGATQIIALGYSSGYQPLSASLRKLSEKGYLRSRLPSDDDLGGYCLPAYDPSRPRSVYRVAGHDANGNNIGIYPQGKLVEYREQFAAFQRGETYVDPDDANDSVKPAIKAAAKKPATKKVVK